jgi:hypothetical protein
MWKSGMGLDRFFPGSPARFGVGGVIPRFSVLAFSLDASRYDRSSTVMLPKWTLKEEEKENDEPKMVKKEVTTQESVTEDLSKRIKVAKVAPRCPKKS